MKLESAMDQMTQENSISLFKKAASTSNIPAIQNIPKLHQSQHRQTIAALW